MKRNTCSLSALLAIILSIPSSFTNRLDYFKSNKWERFGISSKISTAGDSISTICSQIRRDDFRKVFITEHNDIDVEIDEFNNLNSGSKKINCFSRNTRICAAIISYNQDCGSEGRVVDFNLGEYQLK